MTPEEMEAELKRLKDEQAKLESTNARLLEESNKHKSKAREAEEKLTAAQKKQLEDDGEIRKLYEKEKEERERLFKDYSGLKSTTLSEKLRNEVAKHAKDAHNIDDILRVSEAKELLKLDEENLSVGGVEEYVTKVREIRPHFFTQNRVNAGENDPHKKDGQGEDKTQDEKYLEELSRAKTQQEFDNVRKKFGKY